MTPKIIVPSQHEEDEHRELRADARRLHVPVIEGRWKCEVEVGGELVQVVRQYSHSFVRNAFNAMVSELSSKNLDDSTFGAGLLSYKDVGAVIRFGTNAAGLQGNFEHLAGAQPGYLAPSADDTKGIVIGTGTVAESFEDFALQTPIANGVGAGQMSHVAMGAPSTAFAALVFDVIWTRIFNNNSGGSIGVEELGIIAIALDPANASSMRDVLMTRDRVGATVTVPNTGQLTVIYTISTTFPV